MEYEIIEANAKWDLEDKVLKYLVNGWKPQGGVSISNDGGNSCAVIYVQAMVREVE